nr:hypothetical protein [Tanacetum cinerariifolium]
MMVQAQEETGEDEAVNEEMDDSLERAATTTSSLEANQDNGNINKTQSKATLNEPSSIGTCSGSGPRCQDTMGDTIAQTRSENVSKFSNDSLLVGVNTPRSDEDSLKLKELMKLCTNLQNRVLDLENTKTTQALEIDSLKRRVKQLEKKKMSRTHKLKRLYKVSLTARVDSSDEASLENQERFNDQEDAEMLFDVADDLRVKALMEIKSAKPKADKVVIQEPEQVTTTTTLTTTAATTITAASTRPKAKGLVIHKQEQAPTPIISSQHPSQVKNLPSSYKLKKKKKKKKKKKGLPEKKLNKLKKEKKKFYAAKRAEEKRNIPPIRAQQKSIMCTYLKNMEGWKPKSLKNKSFANIQELFDKAMKRVNTFVDYRTELVVESLKKAEAEVREGSPKRAGEELEQENSKKQKMEDDKESAELKQCLEIILEDGDDVTIDATSLSSKSPIIVDSKIHKEGKKAISKFSKLMSIPFYLLFEKMYPLTNHTLHQMFNNVKLQFDYECEMAFELLRLVKKQLKEGYASK